MRKMLQHYIESKVASLSVVDLDSLDRLPPFNNVSHDETREIIATIVEIVLPEVMIGGIAKQPLKLEDQIIAGLEQFAADLEAGEMAWLGPQPSKDVASHS